MADFSIRRRDSKTGNKKERSVRRLSAEELSSGVWGRSVSGSAHHFFVNGQSICGRRSSTDGREVAIRPLCAECFASVGRGVSHEA